MGGSSSRVASDNDHPDNEKVKHEGWDSLKDKKRGCTDIICLLLIIAVWFAMTVVGFIVCGIIQDDRLRQGNPEKLINAIDYKGNICGASAGYGELKYGYYLPDLSVVCVDSCPTENNVDKFICRYSDQKDADENVLAGFQLVDENKCMYKIKTRPFVNRCFPDTDLGDAASDAEDALEQAQDESEDDNYNKLNFDMPEYEVSGGDSGWFKRFLQDLYILRGYIFGFGLGVSTFLAFMYLFVLRIPFLLWSVVWGAILSIGLLLFVGSWLLWDLANQWASDGLHSDTEVTTMRVFAYTGIVVTVLYLCLIIVMRKRIQLALGIVKQAARALATMPTLMLIPVIQVVGVVTFLVPWMIYLVFLASSGKAVIEQGSYKRDGEEVTYSYRTFEYDRNTRYAFLYMIFCWFWTSEFIVAIGQLSIALAFAAWYFVRDKGTIGQGTVRWAFNTTLIYHLGTAAYGSLVIAIIKTIRAVVAYIQKKAKRTGNKIVEYIACVCGCFLWCLEKIMKFINKHAYIITAIYGHSFCKAARKAFFLLLRNILRVAAVNILSTFVLFLGKLLIPVGTVFLCYNALAYGYPNAAVSGLVAPLVLCFLLAYWISTMFLEIFGMGIETLLFCFIADEEMFEPKDRFATGELMTTIQKTQQAAAAAKVVPEETANAKDAEVATPAAPSAPAESAPPSAVAKPEGEVML